ncbi:MAG: hypothetical protein ACFE9L_11300 [Candidatus Hodarchaeota archaeon]
MELELITSSITLILSSNLSSRTSIHSPAVRSKFFIMKKSIMDTFGPDQNSRSFAFTLDQYSYKFELHTEEDDKKLWQVSIKYRKKKEIVKGVSWVYELPNFVLLIAKTQASIFDICERAFNHLYPMISQFFLIRHELVGILGKFELKYLYELYSSNYTIRRLRTTDGEGDKRKTTVTYTTTTPLLEIFNEADLNDMWISSIMIDGYKHQPGGVSEEIQFRITNNTRLTITKGRPLDILAFFHKEIENIAIKRYRLLENRSRSKLADYQIKPIFLEFKEDLFKSKDKINEFLDVITQYKNCQYSVIHSGNPHLFMTISDTIDRSTLNIKSIGTNLAVVIPQIRTSASSLIRFISYIIKNYGECELKESLTAQSE